jgi:uncharacterized protein YjbJ (UPF0337 family)
VRLASGGRCASREREPMPVRRADVSINRKGNDRGHYPKQGSSQGELKDIGGKVQEEAGKLVGSKEQQAKGLQKQAEGKLQKGVGDLKEAVKKA